MKSLQPLIVMLLFSVTSVIRADDAARQRQLMDFGWQFHLGDAPDVGTQFNYAEFTRLDKTRPDDDKQEATNARLRMDAVAMNLGKNVSFVQPGFDLATHHNNLDFFDSKFLPWNSVNVALTKMKSYL